MEETRYEKLMNKAYRYHTKALLAKTALIRAYYVNKYYALVEKARSLTIREAGEKVWKKKEN